MPNARMLIRPKRMKRDGESGEIMLEGIIILTVTMFILFWLIGMCFLYYERYILTIISNDAAKKVAATYDRPTSDVIMGFVSSKTAARTDTYRHVVAKVFGEGNLHNVNENKAKNYVNYMLDITNFPGAIDNVEVTVKTVDDNFVRKHIEVTTTCEFWTPFAGVFDFFGMGRTQEFAVTSYAEVVDYYEYMSTVSFVKGLGSVFSGSGTFINSCVKMLNMVLKIYNKTH